MVEVTDLTKSFNGTTVLDIDRLTIADGDFVGLLGNNGAGKTTLFRLMFDLLRPDTGAVTIDGVGVAGTEPWKAHSGVYLDSSFLIDYLTPEEFFYFIGKTYGMSRADVDARLDTFVQFMNGEILGTHKFIRAMSMGNKQKTGIIAAMLHNPRLLVLDEPFNFLDPSSQICIKEMLAGYAASTGATVVISSHNLNHTIDVCTRVLLLEKGHIIKDLRPADDGSRRELEEYFNIKEKNYA